MTTPLETLLVLAAGHLAIAMSPGPNFLLVLQNAKYNRKLGFFTTLGVWPAGVCWAAATMAGLGALFTAQPWLALVLRLVCGAYLAFLGIKAIVSSGKGGGPAERRPAPSAREAFWGGFITNMTNPKSPPYWLSILTATNAFSLPLAYQICAVLMMPSISFVWYNSMVFIVGSASGRKLLAKLGHWFDYGAGLVMIGFAVLLFIGI